MAESKQLSAEFAKDLDEVKKAVAGSKLAEAQALLMLMHRRYHAFGSQHLQVHLSFMSVYKLQGNYLKVVGHFIAGYVFAIPASWVQSHIGLVFPSFKAKP